MHLTIANSSVMAMLCGFTILVVLLQPILFLILGFRRGRELGMSDMEMREAAVSSAVFSICDRYFVMLDFWNPENFIDSRYSWLELKFPKEDRFEVEETAFFASPLEHNRKEEYCQK